MIILKNLFVLVWDIPKSCHCFWYLSWLLRFYMMYKRDRGYSSCTPLDNAKRMERNPLFEITKTVFLQIVLMKLINLSTYPRFFISRNSLSTLPKAFSWSIDTTNVLLFLEVQFTVSSRIVYKFENIDRFGILDICSLESACSWVIVVMSEDVLHDWIDRSSRPDVLCEKGAACNFIKRETLARVFSCEFCEISKNTFFYRTPLVAASEQKVMNLINKNNKKKK